jgi:nuclease S1
MKRRVCLAVLTAVASTWLVPDLLAWGDDGHQIVARIAGRKLTARTKRQVVTILRAAPDDIGLLALIGTGGDPQPSAENLKAALSKMAIWPDHMPGGKGPTGPWHFVDIGLFEGPATAANRCAEGCVTELITTLIANIRSNRSISVTDDAGETLTFRPDQELRFLIHFLGDIHQPLHASTNADAGGNCVKTVGFPNVAQQLHATWDTALVRKVEKSTLEQTAASISAEFNDEIVVGGVTDPEMIATESFGLARDQIYAVANPTAVPVIDHFVDLTPGECETKAPTAILAATVDGPDSFDNTPTKKIIREQLFKAGVRLATVLNSMFP